MPSLPLTRRARAAILLIGPILILLKFLLSKRKRAAIKNGQTSSPVATCTASTTTPTVSPQVAPGAQGEKSRKKVTATARQASQQLVVVQPEERRVVTAVKIGTPRVLQTQGYAEFQLLLVDSSGEVVHSEWRRYSDFVRFRKALSMVWNSIPRLPPRNVFASQDNAFLEQRRARLELFLQEILRTDPNFRAPLLQKFLGWPPAASGNRVETADEDGVEDGEDNEVEEDADMVEPLTRIWSNSDVAETLISVVEPLKLALARLEEGMSNTSSWDAVASSEEHGVTIFMNNSMQAGVLHTKTVGEIPAPVDAILNVLRNNGTRRHEYDKEFDYDRTLVQFDENDARLLTDALKRDVSGASIRHYVTRSPMPSLIPARDTVVCACSTKREDGSKLLAITSVENAAGPVLETHIRAEAKAIGVFLKCLDANRTEYTEIKHIDLKGRVRPPAWALRKMVPKTGLEQFPLLCKACCDQTKWPAHYLTTTKEE